MTRILGIDTSNYTTSIAIVENNECVLDSRKLLEIRAGERGLRQAEALFQHINNLPEMLNNNLIRYIDGICVSTRPRPVEGSYMPVFKGGENIARAIGYAMGIRVFETSHQEGHLEAAVKSIDFKDKEFIAVHISGGTTELLRVSRLKNYDIQIIGGTEDISAGQFIDRIGVAMGLKFPAGAELDSLALKSNNTVLRIPSMVKGLKMNFSGQETLCLKYLKEGYNQDEIAYGTMLCVAKTLEKAFINVFEVYDLPLLITGGVAASDFIRDYLTRKFKNRIYLANSRYSSDNAVGTAYIGYNKLLEDE